MFDLSCDERQQMFVVDHNSYVRVKHGKSRESWTKK